VSERRNHCSQKPSTDFCNKICQKQTSARFNRSHLVGAGELGHWEGFLFLAATSAIATALLWAAMPETMPAKYLD
jgi:hypothetical protein